MTSSIVGFIRLESKNRQDDLDLPVTKNETNYILVSSTNNPDPQLKLLVNPEPKNLYGYLQYFTIKISTAKDIQSNTEFCNIEMFGGRPKMTLYLQSYSNHRVPLGRRRPVSGRQALYHGDLIDIGSLWSFKVDMSHLRFTVDALENEVVIPSSDQIRQNGLASTMQTQQYFTPRTDTCDGSARVDETPAAVSEVEEAIPMELEANAETVLKSATPGLMQHSINDPAAQKNEETPKLSTKKATMSARIIQETDDETDNSPVSTGSRKKHPLDAGLDNLETKRFKPNDEEAPVKKQRGRPKKMPLTDATPTKLVERRAPAKSDESSEGNMINKPSSAKSVSASPAEKRLASQRSKAKLRIVASKELDQRPTTKKFLQDRFVTVLENVDSTTDILCVVNGELKTTVKIFKALALGIPIVSDKWISDSASARELLPWEDYLAKDPKNEKLLKVPSNWSAGGGLKKRESLFNGNIIMVTAELKAAYGAEILKQLREICQLMGAKDLLSTTTVKSPRVKDEDNVIWLAKDSKDKLLKQLKESGTKVYSKDLLGMSIFQGVLALDDKSFML